MTEQRVTTEQIAGWVNRAKEMMHSRHWWEMNSPGVDFAILEAVVVLAQEIERLRVDAKLGSLVRTMPSWHSLEHVPKNPLLDNSIWWIVRHGMEDHGAMGEGDTPEEAILAAFPICSQED